VCTGRRSLRNALKEQTVNGGKVIATPLKTAGSEGTEERSLVVKVSVESSGEITQSSINFSWEMITTSVGCDDHETPGGVGLTKVFRGYRL